MRTQYPKTVTYHLQFKGFKNWIYLGAPPLSPQAHTCTCGQNKMTEAEDPASLAAHEQGPPAVMEPEEETESQHLRVACFLQLFMTIK